jgi:hypothetical protein
LISSGVQERLDNLDLWIEQQGVDLFQVLGGYVQPILKLVRH